MGQSTYEKDRNRFSLSERLIVELFLFSYVFIFFLGETGSILPYAWLLISIIAGVLSFFLFYHRDYSLGYGVGLALIVTAPLLLFNAPPMGMLILFVYILWRIQANFNGSRIQGWPFLTVNTLVFVILFFLARLMFAHNSPDVLMKQQMILFMLTSFLYFFIRMISVTVNSRQLGNFKVWEAGKVFSYIIGLGSLVFIVVFFAMEVVRSAIIRVLGFLFGGLLTLFGKSMEPLIEFIKSGGEKFIEENLEELDSGFVDFEMKDEMTTYGSTSSIFEYTTLALTVGVLVIIAILLMRRKGKKRQVEKLDGYSFTFKGKKEKLHVQRQLKYDYSSARNEVRKAFEEFEKEAQTFNFSRLQGETVREWFSRMGWQQNDLILSIYNDVRYGSHTPSEKEHSTFIREIEHIKKTFFKKEV